MTLGRFILSSVLVSATFAITAYVLITASLDSPQHTMQTRGVLYLALVPYFLGAFLNKEGYWERTDSLSELLRPSAHKKRSRTFARVVRLTAFVLLAGAAIITYQTWGFGQLRWLAILLLGALWGGTLTRAWFIYKECLSSRSRATR